MKLIIFQISFYEFNKTQNAACGKYVSIYLEFSTVNSDQCWCKLSWARVVLLNNLFLGLESLIECTHSHKIYSIYQKSFYSNTFFIPRNKLNKIIMKVGKKMFKLVMGQFPISLIPILAKLIPILDSDILLSSWQSPIL